MSEKRNGIPSLGLEIAESRSESERRCVDLVRRHGPRMLALAVTSPEEPADSTLEQLKGPRRLKKKEPWKWAAPFRTWTPEDVRSIGIMRADKASWKRIGEVLKRTPEACRERWVRAREDDKQKTDL